MRPRSRKSSRAPSGRLVLVRALVLVSFAFASAAALAPFSSPPDDLADASAAESGAPTTYSATVLADAPLAYWRLGEPAPPNASDARLMFPGIYNGSIELG